MTPEQPIYRVIIQPTSDIKNFEPWFFSKDCHKEAIWLYPYKVGPY